MERNPTIIHLPNRSGLNGSLFDSTRHILKSHTSLKNKCGIEISKKIVI